MIEFNYHQTCNGFLASWLIIRNNERHIDICCTRRWHCLLQMGLWSTDNDKLSLNKTMSSSAFCLKYMQEVKISHRLTTIKIKKITPKELNEISVMTELSCTLWEVYLWLITTEKACRLFSRMYTHEKKKTGWKAVMHLVLRRELCGCKNDRRKLKAWFCSSCTQGKKVLCVVQRRIAFLSFISSQNGDSHREFLSTD